MTKLFRRSEFGPPQRYEEGDGQAEKRDEGKDGTKFGRDSQKERLTLHYKSPGVSFALEVLSSIARVI